MPTDWLRDQRFTDPEIQRADGMDFYDMFHDG